MLHATLSKRLFDAADSTHPVLRQVHRDWILRNVLGNASGTVVLSGDLAGFDYEETSELALTLITDGERSKLATHLASRLDGVCFPGTNYPIQTFVLPGTLTKQALYKSDIRSGYDVTEGMWITPPQLVNDLVRDHYAYALECEDKLELLVDTPKLASRFVKRLKAGGSRQVVAAKHLAEQFPTVKPQYAKFVYHPASNALTLGKMANEEGETYSHYDLLRHHPMPDQNVTFGQVKDDGRGETFGRSKIVRFDPNSMNQYQAEHLTQLAVEHALPGSHFSRPLPKPPPHWVLPGEPTVTYAAEPPVITPASESEPVDPDMWMMG